MYILAQTSAADVITLITLICGLIGAIGTLIPTLIKLYDALKQIVKEKNWEKIIKIANAAMEAAEESGKSGAQKKEMVIEATIAGCKEIGIELDKEELQKLADYIDEMIEWFNNMKKEAEEE